MFWTLYTAIEKAFFNTLTKKIVGNIGFLFVFQLISFYQFYLYANAGASERDTLFYWLMATLFLSAVSFIFTAFYLRYLIVRPVSALLNTLDNINHTQGDLSTQLPTFTQDEFRDLSKAYNQFVSNLHTLIENIHGHAVKTAGKNQSMSGKIATATSAAQQQKTLSHEVADNTHIVTNGINDIVEASNSMAISNKENLANAASANDNLSLSQKQLNDITALLSAFSHTVNGLQQNAGNVKHILKMVASFAEQTNLLALNAAIEAARAGDAGRGFAVVADEVRALSAKVTDATQQINAFLSDMDKLVNETQEESDSLLKASSTMKDSLDVTMETFRKMINDFQKNSTEFSHIATSVAHLNQQSQNTLLSVADITTLSENMQAQLEDVNGEAQQAKALASTTTSQLARFVERA